MSLPKVPQWGEVNRAMADIQGRKADEGVPGPGEVTALDLARGELSKRTRDYLALCREKLGLVPNVLAAYTFDETRLDAFTRMYNDLMLGESGLNKLQREMVAVVVSSANRCFYCLVAHGAAVRELSGDPSLGERLVMNWRTADVDAKERAMLAFAHRLTVAPQEVEEADREALREAGWSDRDIMDIASVAAFFNMTNRVAAASGMEPNAQYHSMAR